MKYFNFNYLTCLLAILLFASIAAFGQQNMPAHYPKQPASTGNAQLDDENWLKAKNEWITNYPDEYRAVGGNPDDIIVKNQPEVATQASTYVNIDFNGKQYYRLVKTSVLDINSKHTPIEMAGYEKEALNDFNQYAIAIDLEKGIWYQKYRNIDGKEWEKKIVLVDNVITYTDCKECLDKFKVIENSPTKLVLQVNPQDAGQFFVYQLEFSK